MGFLTSLFGGGDNTLLTVFLALAGVLLLIVLGVWALKLVFNATGRVSRGRAKRLSVVDVTPVDQKRQLVLVRRDKVEHLIMIGGGQDVVIETGITTETRAERPARPATQSATANSGLSGATMADPEPAPTPATVSDMPLRNPVTQRASLRHTPLVRPNDWQEPELIPSATEKRGRRAYDSAKSAKRPAATGVDGTAEPALDEPTVEIEFKDENRSGARN